MSTKLSSENYEKFQEICNHDGKCISEGLRDLLKMDTEDYEEELELEESKIIVEPVSEEPLPIAYGKILDDYENIIGTF
ncbi:hypothetical protein C5F50_10200 [Nitrosopumilus ureiphilus]|uniref:Uncharacterized protein n=1 Tax=Nitrosopumilus ureiphilus TaxID=1470067 RepID=A0A7D5R7T8_9ARCH|nr:hypothetical protein C5F50_10200 [Nitrosopumilus ureiphilus]